MTESIQSQSFAIAPTPQLYFGAGKISMLSDIAGRYGQRMLFVTGAKSFAKSSYSQEILQRLHDKKIEFRLHSIEREPTPQMIDEVVVKSSSFNPNVVAAIGGGSVMDAGKAISAMLPLMEPVKDYLEGVGTKPSHPGKKIPFIAIPTTAGTGSEATKNAVLSETGEHGYKRSLRHDNFVPDVAIIDPILTLTCSPLTTAASGMDAFTQLLESYLSTRANPVTNALAFEGLKRISKSLLKAYKHPGDLEARADMALAAYLSGVTLANAGLGLVHGFASSIGGYFDISHGIICSSVMAASNKLTVKKLLSEKTNPGALQKYASVGKLFIDIDNKSDEFYVSSFLDLISSYVHELNIPMLDIPHRDFDKIVAVTDNKYNPVALNKGEIKEILQMSCQST